MQKKETSSLWASEEGELSSGPDRFRSVNMEHHTRIFGNKLAKLGDAIASHLKLSITH